MNCKINFVFAKKDMMKYISHLDLMRLLMRGLRRAELPVRVTEGFSPHIKISMKRALKLGMESDHEEAAIVLKEWIKPQDFKERLQAQLPSGIIIKEANSEVKINY